MHIWIWRVRNQVTRQIGEYKIYLASMKSKLLASLASMIFSLCRTLFSHTLKNLRRNERLLWIRVFLAFSYLRELILGIYISLMFIICWINIYCSRLLVLSKMLEKWDFRSLMFRQWSRQALDRSRNLLHIYWRYTIIAYSYNLLLSSRLWRNLGKLCKEKWVAKMIYGQFTISPILREVWWLNAK